MYYAVICMIQCRRNSTKYVSEVYSAQYCELLQ